MQYRIRCFFLSLVMLFCFTTLADAQEPGSAFMPEAIRWAADTGTLSLLVREPRDSIRSVNSATIKLNDFELTDITMKRLSETDVPVTFLFLVDNSVDYTMAKKWTTELILAFLNSRMNNPQDNFLLMTFDGMGSRLYEADDPYVLPEKITMDVQGFADYQFALTEAVQILKDRRAGLPLEKQILILISDGFIPDDTYYSSVEPEDVITALSESGIPLYVAAYSCYDKGKMIDADYNRMQAYAELTGGMIFDMAKPDFSGIAVQSVIDDLYYSYLIQSKLPASFTPSNDKSYQMNISLLGMDSSALLTVDQQVELADLPAGSASSESSSSSSEATATPADTASESSSESTATPADTTEEPTAESTEAAADTTEEPTAESAAAPAGTTEEPTAESTEAPADTTEEPAAETTETSEPATETPVPTSTPVQPGTGGGYEYHSENSMDIWVYICLAVAALFLAATAFILMKRRKSENSQVRNSNHNNTVARTEVRTGATPTSMSHDQNRRNTVTVKLSEVRGYHVSVDLAEGETKYFGRNSADRIMGLGGDGSISGTHFSLTNKNDRIYLRDCNSRNGTFLNGMQISSGSSIKSGDIILAGHSEFKVSIR